MATLTYSKSDLLNRLQAEREKRVQDFEQYRDGARKKAIQQVKDQIASLSAQLKNLEANSFEDNQFYVNGFGYLTKAAKTDDLDSQIRRLEFASEEYLKLTDRQADEILKYL